MSRGGIRHINNGKDFKDMEAIRPEMRNQAKGTLTAHLEFSPTGYLKAILLNAETDSGQLVLERALFRVLNPGHMGWIRRLFHRD
jgi:hypothetical protein